MRHEYRESLPCRPLRPYVECYWHARSDGPPDFRPTELLIPDLRIEVIFSLGTGYTWRSTEASSVARAPRAACIGMRGVALAIEQQGALDTFAIRFRPAGLAPFCSLQVSELTQSCASVEEIWGARGRQLEHTIAGCPSEEQRARIADDFLTNLLAERGAEHGSLARSCVRSMLSATELSVDAVAASHAVGYKRIERAFMRDVGLSPKHVLKVARLQRALVAATATPGASLATAAAEAGYVDQAHMTRDFKQLVGRTPRTFLEERFMVFETLRRSGTIAPSSAVENVQYSSGTRRQSGATAKSWRP